MIDLTDEELQDLESVLFGYRIVAKRGCGLAGCPPETCSEARRARALLKALSPLSKPHCAQHVLRGAKLDTRGAVKP